MNLKTLRTIAVYSLRIVLLIVGVWVVSGINSTGKRGETRLIRPTAYVG